MGSITGEVDRREAQDAVREAREGTGSSLFRVAARSPAVLRALTDAAGALERGTLPPDVRAAIALTVAEANRSDYGLSVHTVLARAAGMTDVAIDAARDARAEEPKTAAILAFAQR